MSWVGALSIARGMETAPTFNRNETHPYQSLPTLLLANHVTTISVFVRESASLGARASRPAFFAVILTCRKGEAVPRPFLSGDACAPSKIHYQAQKFDAHPRSKLYKSGERVKLFALLG